MSAETHNPQMAIPISVSAITSRVKRGLGQRRSGDGSLSEVLRGSGLMACGPALWECSLQPFRNTSSVNWLCFRQFGGHSERALVNLKCATIRPAKLPAIGRIPSPYAYGTSLVILCDVDGRVTSTDGLVDVDVKHTSGSRSSTYALV